MLHTVESKDSQVYHRLHIKSRVGRSEMVKEMHTHTDALDVLRGTCSFKI